MSVGFDVARGCFLIGPSTRYSPYIELPIFFEGLSPVLVDISVTWVRASTCLPPGIYLAVANRCTPYSGLNHSVQAAEGH